MDVTLTTLHTRGSKSTGSIRIRTRPLLHCVHRQEKLTAHHALGLFIWEDGLQMGKNVETQMSEKRRARTASVSVSHIRDIKLIPHTNPDTRSLGDPMMLCRAPDTRDKTRSRSVRNAVNAKMTFSAAHFTPYINISVLSSVT